MIDIGTTELVNAIAIVESDGRQDAVGDGGRAISMFQIHEAFWLDVYNWQQRKHGKQVVDIGGQWSDIGAHTVNGTLRARNTCTVGIVMLTEWLDKHGIPATPENLYAAYTVGRQAFLDCGCEINDPRFPAFKRAKCHRVGELVRHAQKTEPVHPD